ncbi:MAG: hypothetical protein LUE63_09060, partial [Lachnospiraceae bacterium]|nr:hypothetical protein [Lachnospiraceae bacterium]
LHLSLCLGSIASFSGNIQTGCMLVHFGIAFVLHTHYTTGGNFILNASAYSILPSIAGGLGHSIIPDL